MQQESRRDVFALKKSFGKGVGVWVGDEHGVHNGRGGYKLRVRKHSLFRKQKWDYLDPTEGPGRAPKEQLEVRCPGGQREELEFDTWSTAKATPPYGPGHRHSHSCMSSLPLTYLAIVPKTQPDATAAGSDLPPLSLGASPEPRSPVISPPLRWCWQDLPQQVVLKINWVRPCKELTLPGA